MFPSLVTSPVGMPTPSSGLHVPGRERLSKLRHVAPAEFRVPPRNVDRVSTSEIR